MVDASHQPTGVVHLEGIPGTGKTTASQRLCELLTSRGVDAFWPLEEAMSGPPE